MSRERSIKTLSLDGGCYCFNFTNTVHSRTEEQIFDYLNSYDDLLDWSVKVKLLPKERINLLRTFSHNNEREASENLSEIKNKRELLYRFFSSLVNKRISGNLPLDQFNAVLSDALSNLAFKFEKGKIILDWRKNGPDLSEPLRIIFKDAFDLLTKVPANRMKECRACGWLFLDKSKNNSRTWCNMQTCGSIDKSRRYYRRMRAKKKPGL